MSAPNLPSGRSFPLGAVLTVTTGIMLCSIGELYDLLGYMVGEPVWTHQLPRAADESAPAILAQQPQLREVQVPTDLSGEEHVRWWVSTQVDRLGDPLVLEPLAAGEHTSINPVDELRMMRPGVPVIPVVVTGGDS